MIQVILPQEEPTYDELNEKCIWLKSGLREARRNCREAQRWAAVLLLTSTVSTTLLILMWAGYITI